MIKIRNRRILLKDWDKVWNIFKKSTRDKQYYTKLKIKSKSVPHRKEKLYNEFGPDDGSKAETSFRLR